MGVGKRTRQREDHLSVQVNIPRPILFVIDHICKQRNLTRVQFVREAVYRQIPKKGARMPVMFGVQPRGKPIRLHDFSEDPLEILCRRRFGELFIVARGIVYPDGTIRKAR